MRISSLSYTLSIGVAAALLAGCGGSQPPIGAHERERRRMTTVKATDQ
jgi:hypothetical protein